MAEHYRFKIGDAFPADDTTAQWLTSLTMGLNDLLYTNRRLIEGLKSDAAPYENLTGGRAVGAQVWEVLKLLREGSSNPALNEFIESLPDEAKAELKTALAIYDDPARAPFKAALARARDYASHYPELGRRELRRALAALAEQDGELHVGKVFSDARGLWADDVAVQLFFRSEGEEIEPLRAFLADLRDQVLVLTRVLQRMLLTYLQALPPGTLRPDFTPNQVSGPTWIPSSTDYYFSIALPDGAEGHAVVDFADLNSVTPSAHLERVAAALNFQVEGHGSDAIVAALISPDGFRLSLTGF